MDTIRRCKNHFWVITVSPLPPGAKLVTRDNVTASVNFRLDENACAKYEISAVRFQCQGKQRYTICRRPVGKKSISAGLTFVRSGKILDRIDWPVQRRLLERLANPMSAEQKEDQALDYSNRGYTHMTSHIRRPEPSARSMKKTLSRGQAA
jgi:hypothetical protein